MALFDSGTKQGNFSCLLQKISYSSSSISKRLTSRKVLSESFSPATISTWKHFQRKGFSSATRSAMSSSKLYRQTTVLSLNLMPYSLHQSRMRKSCATLSPLPRPTLMFVASSKESQDMASISKCAPYCCNQGFLIKLPLLTMETLSSARVCLLNSTSSPSSGLDTRIQRGRSSSMMMKRMGHTEILWVEERLATRKIELPHPRLLEQGKAALRLLRGRYMRGLGGVKAESAFFVASSGEMIID